MKIAQINTTCGIGSTGKICVEISRLLTDQKVENVILYSSKSNGYGFGKAFSVGKKQRFQALKSRVLGNYGFNSKKSTKNLISILEGFEPDIVHLHNIHSHDCDLDMLFSYFKEKKTKLIWTFHDCWAFTGYCPHFVMSKCDKWKSGCGECIQKREFSWFFDRSKAMFQRKKELFEGQDLTVVTPSFWLADLVKESFLKNHPVNVINNGIDLSLFKPRKSDILVKHGLIDKKIVLGVAQGWGKRKGLDVFCELSRRLPDDYKIVLVGTDKNIDNLLPDGILSIHRTQDQLELAGIYSSADVFVNPTREENFPTVNIEALACGTPVLTFKTGGSPEMLDESCGSVVECEDIDGLEKEVIRICSQKPFSQEACLNKASQYDKNERFKEYLDLYERA